MPLIPPIPPHTHSLTHPARSLSLILTQSLTAYVENANRQACEEGGGDGGGGSSDSGSGVQTAAGWQIGTCLDPDSE